MRNGCSYNVCRYESNASCKNVTGFCTAAGDDEAMALVVEAAAAADAGWENAVERSMKGEEDVWAAATVDADDDKIDDKSPIEDDATVDTCWITCGSNTPNASVGCGDSTTMHVVVAAATTNAESEATDEHFRDRILDEVVSVTLGDMVVLVLVFGFVCEDNLCCCCRWW